jgi:hypothetical protein
VTLNAKKAAALSKYKMAYAFHQGKTFGYRLDQDQLVIYGRDKITGKTKIEPTSALTERHPEIAVLKPEDISDWFPEDFDLGRVQ